MEGNNRVVTLPMPPSVNQIYRHIKTGGTNQNYRHKGNIVYKTKEAKNWVTTAAFLLKQSYKKQMSKVAVYVTAYFTDARRRDLDNICKLLADSLVYAGIIKDDNWLILNEWTLKGRKGPKSELIVYINELDDSGRVI